MKNTFNIIYVIKKSKRQNNGKIPVYCRITIKGRRIEFSINQSVQIQIWEDYQNGKGGKSVEIQKLKKVIEDWTTNINNYSRELLSEGKGYNIDLLRNKIKGIERKKSSFFDAVNRAFDLKKHKIGDTLNEETFKKYERTKEYLKDFIKENYHKNDIYFEDIEGDFPERFEEFLRKKKGCKGNTIGRYFNRVSLVMKYAIRNQLTTTNVLEGYSIERSKFNREFLTEDEIITLYNKKIEIQRLAIIRDLFLFTCLTGLSFKDLKKLKSSEVIKDSKERYWVGAYRQKTGVYFITPILAFADTIFRRYLKESIQFNRTNVFPVPSNQKFNSYLKELGDITGIQKSLSTHCGRHTFATTICADNRASIEVTAKFLGHTKTSTTEIYYRIQRAVLEEDADRLERNLRSKYSEPKELLKLAE